MKYLALLLLASCAALSPNQAARDRTYREIEQGLVTADEASQRDREIPIPWEEIVLIGSALLGISVPASTALTNVMRNNARRKRGEPVGRPVVRPTAQVEEIHEV
jgi:hypothetical protein